MKSLEDTRLYISKFIENSDISKENIRWLNNTISKFYNGPHPRMSIKDDKLHFTWKYYGWEIFLNLDLSTHIGKLLTRNINTGEFENETLDLNDLLEWDKLMGMFYYYTYTINIPYKRYRLEKVSGK